LATRLTRRAALQTSLLGAAGFFATGSTIAQSPPAGPTSAERQRLAHLAADLMDWYEAPGLSVAIAAKGEPVYVEAFGFADKERQETLTTQHRFRIASVTKPITSAGILLLMQSGRLRLADHVFGPNSILGDEYKTPPDRQEIEKITVEHLLTHTSGGWSNNHDDPMFKNKQMNHRELINWTLENEPLTAEPGYHYAYSNFGYCLLGRIIERTTNQKYEQYIRDALLTPSAVPDMQIAGNTLEERAANEVKYYSRVAGQDPYDLNIARMGFPWRMDCCSNRPYPICGEPRRLKRQSIAQPGDTQDNDDAVPSESRLRERTFCQQRP
jgi:CubicO group peptidase (beta-lactamase class C family)